MLNLRSAAPTDLEAVYDITLQTGDAGADATGLYEDRRLLGHIYSAPYLTYLPGLSVIAEVDGVPMGFCVGALDTSAFARLLEAEWWPGLRKACRPPDASRRANWSADERLRWLIHEPEVSPADVVDRFPAHLHMNVLPALQGQGVGKRLLNEWIGRAARSGATGAHVGVSPDNRRALGFWGSQGFREIPGTPEEGAIWLGRSLP